MHQWYTFLAVLERKYGKTTTDKWLKTLEVVKFDARNLYLQSLDSFQLAWFKEHAMPLANKLFVNNNGDPIKIHITSKDVSKPQKSEYLEKRHRLLVFDQDITHEHCTLEQYISTDKNQIPFEVFCRLLGFDTKTKRCGEPNKESFNPIYIYGPNGVGKTHLLMAATTFLKLCGKKVFFIRTETFTEHVVNAIRSGNMQNFRTAYRSSDILIIDDIQVLGRKNATQEEFFHTFNTLHMAKKQIIISANVTPRLLRDIADRLVSRFEWGITLPLEKPTEYNDVLNTIIEERTKLHRINFSKQLIEFLIKHFTTPSMLSGAIDLIRKTKHYPESTDTIDLAHVNNHLSRLIEEYNKTKIDETIILSNIANLFGIKKEDLTSKSQSRESVLPRQMAMFMLRNELKLPYIKIGNIFDKDHSTVISSIKRVEERIKSRDHVTINHINQLKIKLYNEN